MTRKSIPMNVYTHNGFTGRWPVPTAAVVVAKDKRHAVRLLQSKLKTQDLEQKISAKDFTLVSADTADVIILSGGDY